jgi:flavin-dependent dehydrogenase
VVLVGDAAGYLDALTGEGISLAAAQAAALGEHVAPLLESLSRRAPMVTVEELNAYRKAYLKLVRPYFRMTSLALMINRHPRLAEVTIGIFARHPGIFQSMLSANMGSSWLGGVNTTGFGRKCLAFNLKNNW